MFEKHAHPIAQGLTRENLHARIRGVLMMVESNDTGALLISCGNETEIALGYATLYGDMCGGISLIGDLSKTDVYSLSRLCESPAWREIIPEEAFAIRPSAELAAGQFDPFDYAVVSPIVSELVERRTEPRGARQALRAPRARPVEIRAGRRGPDRRTTSTRAATFRGGRRGPSRRVRRSVYKRLQGPPIVVVSERAFGFDLRETIINGWEG